MVWKFREVSIQDDKSIGDSGSDIIDLNVRDPITSLIVRFGLTNGAAVTRNQPPERQIAKIEITDGGQTYWSLTGQESVAAAIDTTGVWPSHWYDERATIGQSISIPLFFGRYAGDEEFALDPRKMLNPQLKVTWSDQALYLDDSLTLGVTARVMEGLAAPPKALMWRGIEAWTTASSGEKKVDLPVDFPFRKLLVRGWGSVETLPGIFSAYKLDCDVGKFIGFDLSRPEMFDILKQGVLPVTHRQTVYASWGYSREAWLGECNIISGSAGNSANYLYVLNCGWSHFICRPVSHAGAASETDTAELGLVGWFPHNSLIYQFGLPDKPETWFPSRSYGEIALKITEAIASCDGSVAIQQPRAL